MKFRTILLFLSSWVILFSSLLSQTQLEKIISPSNLPYLKKSKLIQISSYDTTGGNNDRINIHSGNTAVLADVEGPGVITRIWVTIDSRDPYFLRRILLRIYWDGEENPSVEAPIGDFFGNGFQYTHYYSAFAGMTSGGYFCYLPMPFNKSARIEVVNQTGEEVYAFYYHIDYQKLEEPLDKDIAYFHAQWRRDIRTNNNENYLILDAEGEGHFVGVNMNMQPYKNSYWYLEGDEMIYVDGEQFPSVYGTGMEDYFTSGWYFKNGEYSAPYHGLIMKDDSTSRIVAYRYHIGDAVPFKKSIKVTIEHGHANEEIADFSSTAFWYQMEPHKKFEKIPNGNLRIPLRATIPNGLYEAENIKPSDCNLQFNVEDMSEYGPEWSGLKQLRVEGEKENDMFSLNIPESEENAYNITLFYTTGPNYGDVEIFNELNKIGVFSGYNKDVMPGGKIELPNVKSGEDNTKLSFKISGKDKKSSGYAVGLDGFKLVPVREYIPEWYMIGPFANPRTSDIDRKGLDTKYPPEKEIDLQKTYSGKDGQQIKWTSEKTPESGQMSLWEKYTPSEFVVAYALTYVYSPEDQRVQFFIGSDDGSKVFLNDKEIYRFLDVRISAPDQDKVILNLKKGWNKLLLKIENNFGGYAFYARILDKKGNLIINKDQIN
ncbi:MAG: DUF2961 domain-containing protein [Bacteroidetes bacterium]|nr:DUF2961 domain-containing protein [Bacteroidota bacterium]